MQFCTKTKLLTRFQRVLAISRKFISRLIMIRAICQLTTGCPRRAMARLYIAGNLFHG